ncbi:MAG: hypothetical protein HRT70_10895 [Flavobacteriaceae bacterium]|nr:hypothetical protein [Flavobacteriaceae bacterium]
MTANETPKKETLTLINHTVQNLFAKGKLSNEKFKKGVKGKEMQQVVSDILKVNEQINRDDIKKGKLIVDKFQSIESAVENYFSNWFYTEMAINA